MESGMEGQVPGVVWSGVWWSWSSGQRRPLCYTRGPVAHTLHQVFGKVDYLDTRVVRVLRAVLKVSREARVAHLCGPYT